MEIILTATRKGAFPVIPIREMITIQDHVIAEATKSVKPKKKAMKLDFETGLFTKDSSDPAQAGLIPGWRLILCIKIYSTAFELCDLGRKSDWMPHVDIIHTLSGNFETRGVEIIWGEASVRSLIAQEVSHNGGDFSAAIKTVYDSPTKAAKVWAA